MNGVVAQISCGCLDLILTPGKKLVDKPLIEALGNMNIK